jgi:hypothetical protein
MKKCIGKLKMRGKEKCIAWSTTKSIARLSTERSFHMKVVEWWGYVEYSFNSLESSSRREISHEQFVPIFAPKNQI